MNFISALLLEKELKEYMQTTGRCAYLPQACELFKQFWELEAFWPLPEQELSETVELFHTALIESTDHALLNV